MTKLIWKSFLLIIPIIFTNVVFFLLVPTNLAFTYHGAVIDKVELLETAPPPRIIFVGGSMLAFGLDSEKLQKELGYSIVNFGTHAAYGLRFMLDIIKQGLQPGDIIIIIPEYELFFMGVDGHETMAELILAYPEALKYMKTIGQIQNIIEVFPRIMEIKEEVLYSKPKPHGVYSRGGFNIFGDVISHLGKQNHQIDVDKSNPFYADPAISPSVEKAVFLLNDFIDIARQKGVGVYFMYPALLDQMFFYFEDSIIPLSQKLEKEIHAPIISKPHESVFPIEFFFDTVYHLNMQGREKFTQLVLEKISKHILNISIK